MAAVTVRDRAIRRRVLAHAAIASGEQVLDVGCGTGTLAVEAARAAPGVRVTGLDADASVLARARKRAAVAGLEIGFDKGMSTTFRTATPASTWCSRRSSARLQFLIFMVGMLLAGLRGRVLAETAGP